MSTVLGFVQAFDAAAGRVVVHPTMGVSNLASVYASPGKTLEPAIGELAAQLCAWRSAERA